MDALYTIDQIEETGQGFVARISLNAGHAIFKGHFPQQPVLPGVCQLEMISDAYSKFMAAGYRMESAREVKYASMILPDKHPNFVIEFSKKDKQDHTISCLIKNEQQVFLKAKLTLVPQTEQ